jgi:hypothetical protein
MNKRIANNLDAQRFMRLWSCCTSAILLFFHTTHFHFRFTEAYISSGLQHHASMLFSGMSPPHQLDNAAF